MQLIHRRNISIVALLVLFSSPFSLLAKHIIGGDITYEYLGDGSGNTKEWRFTMKIYRDCNGGGAPFDYDASIAIYRGSYQNNIPFDNFFIGYNDFTQVIPDTPQCVT